MQSIVTMIAGVPAAPGAPVVPAGNIKPLYPGRPESGAVEHWLLGSSSASLVGLKGVRSLVPVASAPTFEADHAILANGVNGLRTGIADSVEYTLALVLRLDNEAGGTGKVLGGTSGSSSLDAKGVLIAQNVSNSIGVTPRPHASATPFATDQLTPAIGQFVFLCLSVQAQNVTTFLGRVGRVSRAVASPIVVSDRQIAVGNAYYSGATFQSGIRVAEAIVWPSALNADQVEAVYARSQQRAMERGMVLY